MKRSSASLGLVERHGSGKLMITEHDGDTARPIQIKGDLRLTRSQIETLISWLEADPAEKE